MRAVNHFLRATSHAPGVPHAPSAAGYTGPLLLPPSLLDAAAAAVPKGYDRLLVAQAVEMRCQVFLTEDKDVLAAAEGLEPFGLALASPQELLAALAQAGAFHCLLEPARYLTWPLPDQARVTHLLRALPEAGNDELAGLSLGSGRSSPRPRGPPVRVLCISRACGGSPAALGRRRPRWQAPLSAEPNAVVYGHPLSRPSPDR